MNRLTSHEMPDVRETEFLNVDLGRVIGSPVEIDVDVVLSGFLPCKYGDADDMKPCAIPGSYFKTWMTSYENDTILGGLRIDKSSNGVLHNWQNKITVASFELYP